jgi:hypothetical protein
VPIWRKVTFINLIKSPIFCISCRDGKQACSFAEVNWGVQFWPRVGPRKKVRTVKKKVEKKARTSDIITRSRSEGSPLPSISISPSIPGSGVLSELTRLRGNLLSSNDSYALTMGLAELRGVRSRTESELEVTSMMMREQLQLTNGLIREFEQKLGSLRREDTPDFVVGSSKDAVAPRRSPRGRSKTEEAAEPGAKEKPEAKEKGSGSKDPSA